MLDLLSGDFEVVDLSSVLGVNTFCYPTDPQFKKRWHIQMPEAVANVSVIETGLHAGTHVDAPLHFIEEGMDVCQMPVTSFFGPAVAIDAPKKLGEDVVPADFEGKDIRKGDIVLVHTGWGSRINTDMFYEKGWPGFSSEAIDMLLEIGVKAIGFDSPAADNCNAEENGFPAHKKTLGANVPIYESLINLDKVVGHRFIFIGLPLRIEEGEASLVRAIAILA
jgi:kynurenine formamidase